MWKRKRTISLVLILLMMMTGLNILTNIPAESILLNISIEVNTLFAGGSGTESDPYQISNVTELQQMKDDIYAHYILVDDIDASDTVNWNGGKGFEIIVPDQSPGSGVGGSKFFGGSLEGNGYSIHDLYINRVSEEGTSFIGLMGNGRVSNLSLIDCDITGYSMVGGITGITFPGSSIINNCHVTGFLTGTSNIGGIVGYCYSGSLIGCSANVSMIGTYNVGGLIGYIVMSHMYDCYSTGILIGDYSVGGLVGEMEQSTVRNSFYNINRTYINGENQLSLFGIFEAQFNDWQSNEHQLDIDDYLQMDPESGYYEISSVRDIINILPFATMPDYSFIQTADIDMEKAPGLYIPLFLSRNYDGGLFKIRNVNLDFDDIVMLGFFGIVGEEGNCSVISNITFLNTSITGVSVVGTIGHLYQGSKAVNINSQGIFIGHWSAGVVGLNEGIIEGCCSSGSVEGTISGGLVGYHYDGVISNSYSICYVKADEFSGGLCGYSHGGSIVFCYAVSDVTGENFIGFLVGAEYQTFFESCFWKTRHVTDYHGVGGDPSDPPGVIGKMDTDMKRKKTFSDKGWDFSTTWKNAEDHSYPFFQRSYTPPEILIRSIEPISIEGSLYSDDIDFAIQQGLPGTINKPSFTLDSNKGFLSIDSEGTISGIPDDEDFGSCWVNISITDLCGESDSSNFTLNVHNINEDPIILTSSLPDATEDLFYSFEMECFDIDPTNDSLTWSLETNLDFLEIDETTGIISSIPSNDDVGTWQISVNVTDGNGGFDEVRLFFNVINVNDDPFIKPYDMVDIYEDSSFFINFDAVDVDPTRDILSWTYSTNASFMQVNPRTGNLTGFPTNDHVGSWWVNITVSDGNGGFDWRYIHLKVLNVNDGPVLDKTDITLRMDEDSNGTTLDLYDVFIDIDGDPLTFDHGDSGNLSISILEGLVTIIPDCDWSGSEIIRFSASDGALSEKINILIIVDPANDAPENVLIYADPFYMEGGYQIVNSSAIDVDLPFGDVLTYIWSSNVTGHIGVGKAINLSLPTGFHLVTLTVTDRGSLYASASVEIEIKSVQEDLDDKGERNNFPLIPFIIAVIAFVLIICSLIAALLVIKWKKVDRSQDQQGDKSYGSSEGSNLSGVNCLSVPPLKNEDALQVRNPTWTYPSAPLPINSEKED